MIEKLDTGQPLIDSGMPSGQPNAARALPNKDEDVSLHVNYASLIEKAVQEPEDDAQRVQTARELLLSGQLERPENIRQAAENIVDYGI